MSPLPSSARARLVAVSLALAASAAPAGAQAVLDVSGEVLGTDPQLEVRVVVTNRGDQPAAGVEVIGELLGQERRGRLDSAVAPRQSASVVLAFDPTGAPAGVHALTLLLEHPLPGTPDAGGNPPLASQRAWLLVALGASPPQAVVRLAAAPSTIQVRGRLPVDVASADGRAHRVRLRALAARGLRVETGPLELDVPASGASRVALEVVRAGAPRGTRHGVLLVAESLAGEPVSTTVEVAWVEVAPDRPLLPRARFSLLILAGVMLSLVVGAEVWRERGTLARLLGRSRSPEA